MAKGRTISASFLTDKDRRIIGLCDNISKLLCDKISDKSKQKDFMKNWGKISFTRDGGLGLGGGKLQRDALCTRGRGGKAPFSNRNLRWHPLIASSELVPYAKPIEKIEIEDDVLTFVVKNKRGEKMKYPSDKVYEMEETYVVTSEHWQPHIATLRSWGDTEWTQNSCVIPALESCSWDNAVESYALLGMSVAVALYGADFEKTYNDVADMLKNQTIDPEVSLPSEKFPKDKDEYILCPMSKIPINENLEFIRKEPRGTTWQPNWLPSKRDEGDDSSLQIMHVNPLIEKEQRHACDNVRYGFRWCNIAMTDHSLEETLDFMEDIVKAHRGKWYEKKSIKKN